MQATSNRVQYSRLRDGTIVRLRPIGPADRARLAAGFAHLSPRSRYLRFFTPMPRLPQSVLQRLVATDGANHVAIGAEIAPPVDQPEGVGVAHLFRREDDPTAAEVSIVVIDSRQRQGLGRVLLRELARVARGLGIEKFTATVLRENEPVRRLLESYQLPFKIIARGDHVEYEITLPDVVPAAA